MGYDVPRGAAFPAPMVGWALRKMGNEQLWRVVPHLSATECRFAAQRLENLRLREVTWAESLQEEKWTQQASLLEVMRTLGWEKSFFADDPPRIAHLRAMRINNCLVMANTTRLFNLQIAQARQPYPLQTPLPTPAPAFSDPITTVYAPPFFVRAPTQSLRASAFDALLLTALSLRTYALEHGAYPRTLAALVPRYIKKIPFDPFDFGVQLHYSSQRWRYLKEALAPSLPTSTLVTGGTSLFEIPLSGPPVPHYKILPYTLYSVGPDAHDNGGKPVDEKRIHADEPRRWVVDFDSGGDTVAGLNH